MTSLTSDLLSVLGKSASDPEVIRVIVDNDLVDSYDDPPFRRYVGSEKKGADLLFDNNRVLDIQIYVQSTGPYSAYSDSLPLGIKKGMTQSEVHQILGAPESSDQFDSKYLMKSENAKLTVTYDDKGVVRYMSIVHLKEL